MTYKERYINLLKDMNKQFFEIVLDFHDGEPDMHYLFTDNKLYYLGSDYKNELKLYYWPQYEHVETRGGWEDSESIQVKIDKKSVFAWLNSYPMCSIYINEKFYSPRGIGNVEDLNEWFEKYYNGEFEITEKQYELEKQS